MDADKSDRPAPLGLKRNAPRQVTLALAVVAPNRKVFWETLSWCACARGNLSLSFICLRAVYASLRLLLSVAKNSSLGLPRGLPGVRCG